MKVIIAGSRSITDYYQVYSAIVHSSLEFSDITEVVSGTALGVDKLGEVYATKHNVPIKRFPAQWSKHGKSAGFKRNAEMAKYADFLIAVHDGYSRGTEDMIRQMKCQGKQVYVHLVLKYLPYGI